MRAYIPRHLGRIAGIVIVPLTLFTSVVLAQAPAAAERAAAVKEALAQNQAALKQYTWIETTDVSLKGEVKKHEQKQCSYGADGKVVKTPMAGAAPAAPKEKEKGGGGRRGGGRVKESIVENKVEDLKEYMEKVVALVHQYVPPDPQKIKAAESAGNVAASPGTGVTTLTVKSYAKPGDALAIGFDPAAKKLSSYSVTSYVEKPKDDDVTLNVMFGRLADGTSYPQEIVMVVKAKNIQVKITNSGHKKAGA
jgi:hypothetical protein